MPIKKELTVKERLQEMIDSLDSLEDILDYGLMKTLVLRSLRNPLDIDA